MKRLIIAALAASVLSVPVLQAEAAPMPKPSVATQSMATPVAERKVVKKRVVVRRHGPAATTKTVTVTRFKRGGKYSGWRNHRAVTEYSRYGLYRPSRGTEWIRVGGDYLLISIGTGRVNAVIAAR